MNINRLQVIAIIIAVVSVLSVSGAQLTDIVGPAMAKTITSCCGLLTTVLGSVLAVITGQSSIIQQAQSMPGVERIQVNTKANPTLAALAVDPAQDKIEPVPGSDAALKTIANQ